MMPTEPVTLHYTFTLPKNRTLSFDIRLDGRTLQLITTPATSAPAWTRLSFQQCPNCPLNEAEHPQCPIAANLAGVVEPFRDADSQTPVTVEVTAAARAYRTQTTLQRGLSSLLGIYMVTSGCPVMDKLRPMVRTHLPFAQPEETFYRLLSMYLLAQYVRQKSEATPDWGLRDLPAMLEQIRLVNHYFAQRLASLATKDATLNALQNLNGLADTASLMLQEDQLQSIERLFRMYLTPAPDAAAHG